MTHLVTTPRIGYGARPVSVDIARGRPLYEAGDRTRPRTAVHPLPLTHQVVADRLALARWPYGHQIAVCGLAGGTGRTTLSGLLATVLAELPYAHLHRPVALVETTPRGLTVSPRRWGMAEPEPHQLRFEPTGSTPSGAWVFQDGPCPRDRPLFSVLIIDAPVGMPSDLSLVLDDPHASVVLLTRPDRTSLADAADALVWMHQHSAVTRDRVTVVINNGLGGSDRNAKAAATVLGIRCAAIHRLGPEPTLGPGLVLPSGRALRIRLRRTVARICLDVWLTIAHPSIRSIPKEHP